MRHTEPASAEGQWRFLGRADPQLSPAGVEHAHRLARALGPVHFDSIYSSDLTRCLQTAQIIAGSGGPPHAERDVPVQPDARFREIDVGLWEGLTRAEAAERYPKEYERRERDVVASPFPGGESFADVRERALPAFYDMVAHSGDSVLIVAHKGVNRVLLCEFLGLPLDQLFSLRQDYGCVNIVRASRHADGPLSIEAVEPDVRLGGDYL